MSPEVLLVDDEEVFADLTREQLTRRGFSVTVACSGKQALEMVGAQAPAAILLDILMPGLSGEEVLRRLKADPKTRPIPIIICSVTLNEKAKISALLAMGADDYMTKPCEPDRLAEKLKKLIASGQSHAA